MEWLKKDNNTTAEGIAKTLKFSPHLSQIFEILIEVLVSAALQLGNWIVFQQYWKCLSFFCTENFSWVLKYNTCIYQNLMIFVIA